MKGGMTAADARRLYGLLMADSTEDLPAEFRSATLIGICVGVALSHQDHEAGDVLLDMADGIGDLFASQIDVSAKRLAMLIGAGLTRRLDA